MDSWAGNHAPALARVACAVEQMMYDSSKVRGTAVDRDLINQILHMAIGDWIIYGEDWSLFRNDVVLCWNAKQAELRKARGET